MSPSRTGSESASFVSSSLAFRSEPGSRESRRSSMFGSDSADLASADLPDSASATRYTALSTPLSADTLESSSLTVTGFLSVKVTWMTLVLSPVPESVSVPVSYLEEAIVTDTTSLSTAPRSGLPLTALPRKSFSTA